MFHFTVNGNSIAILCVVLLNCHEIAVISYDGYSAYSFRFAVKCYDYEVNCSIKIMHLSDTL